MVADELSSSIDFYSKEVDKWIFYCDELTACAESELDILQSAERTLNNGIPVEVSFKTNHREAEITLLAVQEGDSLYNYELFSTDEQLQYLQFSVAPFDSIWINECRYTADSAGNVEIFFTDELSTNIYFIWDSNEYGQLVAQFGPKIPSTDSISRPQNPTNVPDMMSDEEFEKILSTMNLQQLALIADLSLRQHETLELLQQSLDLSSDLEILYSYIQEKVSLSRNALLTGEPIKIALQFDDTLSVEFNVLAVDANSPVYTYHNPFGGCTGNKLVLQTFPHAQVSVNNAIFSSDENGIVVIPLNGESVPSAIEILISSDSTNYIVFMNCSDNESEGKNNSNIKEV